MSISKVSGTMLRNILERDGANLAISNKLADTPIFLVDVANARIGINTATPTVSLDIAGNILATGICT